jgi:uncharacterized membrane protein
MVTAPPIPTGSPRPAEGPTDRPRFAEAGMRREWRDLALVIVVSIVAFASVGFPLAFRIPVGILALLLCPGYALVATLFPDRQYLDFAERIGASIAASFAVIVLESLVLDRAGIGLTLPAIRMTVAATTCAMALVALFRRRGVVWVKGDARPAAGARAKALRFAQAIVVVEVLVAALAYALAIADAGSAPTELYLLGSTNRLADYPRQVVVGQPFAVRLGVRQDTGASGRYTLLVRAGGDPLKTVGPIALKPGETWESEEDLSLQQVGDDQELTVVLSRDGSEQPFRTVRLWVDVRAGATG